MVSREVLINIAPAWFGVAEAEAQLTVRGEMSYTLTEVDCKV